MLDLCCCCSQTLWNGGSLCVILPQQRFLPSYMCSSSTRRGPRGKNSALGEWLWSILLGLQKGAYYPQDIQENQLYVQLQIITLWDFLGPYQWYQKYFLRCYPMKIVAWTNILHVFILCFCCPLNSVLNIVTTFALLRVTKGMTGMGQETFHFLWKGFGLVVSPVVL